MCYYDTEFSTEYIDVTIVIQLYDVFVVVVMMMMMTIKHIIICQGDGPRH